MLFCRELRLERSLSTIVLWLDIPSSLIQETKSLRAGRHANLQAPQRPHFLTTVNFSFEANSGQSPRNVHLKENVSKTETVAEWTGSNF